MKKIFSVVLLLFTLAATSCATDDVIPSFSECDIQIIDETYCETVNDVYMNYTMYVGNSIAIEGVFGYYSDEIGLYNYVFRKGPGCCAYDGDICGFEFDWNGDFPAEGDWITVIGVLELHEEEYDGELLKFICINAESVVSHGKASSDDLVVEHSQKQ